MMELLQPFAPALTVVAAARWHGDLAERLVRRPQPLGQHTHHLQSKIRGLTYQKQELLFGNRDQFDIGNRDGRRASRFIVDQRHLPENAVRLKVGDRPVADLYPHLSALDDEEFAGFVAFPKNNASGL
jgi:hypothetical protein